MRSEGPKLGSISVLVLGAALCTACSRNSGTISVVNKSAEPIARVVVMVCAQKLELINVGVSEAAQATYRITCEGHYSIQVEFQSGRRLQKDIGYVTGGFNFRDEIVVTAFDIDFGDRQVDRP